jgi:hypothetical protein
VDRPAAPIAVPQTAFAVGGRDAESRAWVEALSGTGHARDDAVERLHGLLLRASSFEIARRRDAGGWGYRLTSEDLAMQAADDAPELAQPDDPLAGQVADVRHPMKREQVVHAQRVKRDRPGDDQLVVSVAVGKRGGRDRLRGQQFGIGIGHATRRVLQTGGVRVGTERPQEVASGAPRAGKIDLALGVAACARLGQYESVDA